MFLKRSLSSWHRDCFKSTYISHWNYDWYVKCPDPDIHRNILIEVGDYDFEKYGEGYQDKRKQNRKA